MNRAPWPLIGLLLGIFIGCIEGASPDCVQRFGDTWSHIRGPDARLVWIWITLRADRGRIVDRRQKSPPQESLISD
jgi:hypothetical protein